MMTPRIIGLLPVLATLVACASESPSEAPSSGAGIGTVSVAMDTDAMDSSEGSGQGTPPDGDDAPQPEGDSGGSTPLFDLGDADDGSVPPEAGCERVDFLFVIDNSVSMEDNQAALVGAFPGFIDAIESAIEAGSDYHIMVTDTDPWGRCNTVNGFDGIDPGSTTCNNYIKTTAFEPCDAERGAGVVHPAGQHATNAPCTLAGGQRYIVPGEPDLAAAFACVAKVGVAGNSSERPMESMLAALSGDLDGVGQCNEGFLRDDALLVVTFVSDDSNWEDTGMPEEWYQAVVDAKLGDPTSVVMLGLTPAWQGCGIASNPVNGAHWKTFVELWGERGIHGNVCGTAEDYVAFFQSAVGTIEQACDDYVPPG